MDSIKAVSCIPLETGGISGLDRELYPRLYTAMAFKGSDINLCVPSLAVLDLTYLTAATHTRIPTTEPCVRRRCRVNKSTRTHQPLTFSWLEPRFC
ncbi:hypothetical protein RRG08_014939 [Elysia crispata]|uniref:Uncharacterized protein n=1 Tax=Elysia crispata TaxID=231223 RepID=A0AAE1E7R2_9GAST|nr:hypothetical protein RRG08_014939 [Elysia crispata]